jgi:hypothetical protein
MVQKVNAIFFMPGGTEGLKDEILAFEGGVLDAVEAFGLLDDLTPDEVAEAQALLGALPAALDAAIMAVVKSAVARDLPAQVTWRPAYSFELSVLEDSAPENGGVTGAVVLQLAAPHPGDLPSP